MRVIQRVDERNVDCLAAAGTAAMEERRRDRAERVHAGHDVGDACVNELRRSRRIARHMADSGERLRHEVEADLAGERAGAAERRDGGHDEAGVEATELRVAESALVEHAGAEVLDHHVDFGSERAQELECLGLREVEAEALLAAVLLDEVGAAALLHERQHARRVASWGELDLDDRGAELCHEARDRRPGEVLGEIQDEDSGEDAGLRA